MFHKVIPYRQSFISGTKDKTSYKTRFCVTKNDKIIIKISNFQTLIIMFKNLSKNVFTFQQENGYHNQFMRHKKFSCNLYFRSKKQIMP